MGEITNMPDLEVNITDFKEYDGNQDQENTNIHEIIRNFGLEKGMTANFDYEEVEIMKMVNYDNDTTVIIKEEMDVIEDKNWISDSSFGSGILNSDRLLVMKYLAVAVLSISLLMIISVVTYWIITKLKNRRINKALNEKITRWASHQSHSEVQSCYIPSENKSND